MHGQKETSVFISYARGSAELDANVRKLADSLNNHGINCDIDQYEPAPMEGWPKWMITKVNNSTYVLIAITKRYLDSYMGVQGGGKGVPFESTLAINDLFENKMINDKFLPIVFQKSDIEFTIPPLRGFHYYDLSSHDGFENLIRRLTNQPKIRKPPLGSPKLLKIEETKKNIFTIPDESLTGESDSLHDPNEGDATVAVDTGRKLFDLELHLDVDPESWTANEQEKFLNIIKHVIGISDIKIKGIRKGSIHIKFELSLIDSQRLIDAVNKGVLDEFNVVGAEVLQVKSNSPLMGLTVKQIQDLADILKTHYGIEPAASAALAGGAPVEEKTSFNVILKAAGGSKLKVVKIVKELIGLGLKEAKELVDGAPMTIKEGVGKAEAEEMRAKLADAGAEVEVQ